MRALAPLRALLLLLVLLPAAGPVQARAADGEAPAATGALTTEAVFAKVRAAYGDAKTVQAAFEQTQKGFSFPAPVVRTGRLELKKPNKLRMAFDEPADAYLFDGEQFVRVDGTAKEAWVYRSAGNALQRIFDFFVGEAVLDRDFAVSVVADGPERVDGMHVLRLDARNEDAGIRTAYLRVAADSGRITGLVTETPFGDRTTTLLKDLVLDGVLDDARFTWSDKDGWRTVAGD